MLDVELRVIPNTVLQRILVLQDPNAPDLPGAERNDGGAGHPRLILSVRPQFEHVVRDEAVERAGDRALPLHRLALFAYIADVDCNRHQHLFCAFFTSPHRHVSHPYR